MSSQLAALLKAGDMRTIGNVDKVVQLVSQSPPLLSELIKHTEDTDPGLRMRASDALEKFSVIHFKLLEKYKSDLLSIAKKSQQQEVQWHLCQILPRLELNDAETVEAYNIINTYFNHSKSRIVLASAIESMAILSKSNPELSAKTHVLIEQCLSSEFPAVRARARRLLGN